ncbi:hypothetical protein COMA1_10373 [Candidatus Nitrospira nitrosa]|uniref:Uncharacterized protein n=1 Tax=Candidatus Nitrospira nitrosa TaxID=1742972 RepID=A0A0S4L2S1_9BACT|nr:hypothetical protein COMA1_10373 [Candidatus Nitrospira nitrosa]
MVRSQTTPAPHNPETSIGIVIALEHGHQFRFAARGTGQVTELEAKCHDRLVVARHATSPSSMIPPSSMKRA